MKAQNTKLLYAIVLILFAPGLLAQTAEFEKAQDDNWLVNINDAYELSKSTNKPILANFTGSDWCGWCKRLRAEVFDTAEFKDWAKENVVLLELDFPRKKQLPEEQRAQNQSLSQFFKVTGFPTVWMFDIQKNEDNSGFQLAPYGKTGYVQGGPDRYTSDLEKMIERKNN
jgi:protein disulfide-isomerase